MKKFDWRLKFKKKNQDEDKIQKELKARRDFIKDEVSFLDKMKSNEDKYYYDENSLYYGNFTYTIPRGVNYTITYTTGDVIDTGQAGWVTATVPLPEVDYEALRQAARRERERMQRAEQQAYIDQMAERQLQLLRAYGNRLNNNGDEND